MSYEEEQRRLQKLWDELESEEEVGGNVSSDCSDDGDYIQESDHFSDTEQSDASDSDSDVSPDESEVPLSERLQHYQAKNGTRWLKKPFPTSVKQRPCDIIRFFSGVTNLSKNAVTPMEAWNLFFPNSTIEEIVACTNIYILKVRTNYTRERDAKCTDVREIKAVIGLLYLAGVLRSSHVRLSDLWAKDGTGVEAFRVTMSLKRFEFLLRCMRFDDANDRQQRKRTDKLAPIRKVFDDFVARCQENYVTGENVTIDEMLESFRGRCGFRQYIKNKPARYGIKIFSMVDSTNYYTFNMEVYVGKQPEGQYLVDNSAFNVVKRLVQPILNSGRNLTTDNWFTSFPLAKYLLENNITTVGTVRKNKTDLPRIFTDSKGRDRNSSLFGFQKDTTIVSYVPKEGKIVILLSTLHHTEEINESTGEKQKPEVITYYNATKGGVDIVDQMKGTYSVSRKSARWPLTIFFTLLNIAGINSKLVYEANTKANITRRHYLKDLSMSLTKDYILHRLQEGRIPTEMRAVACRIVDVRGEDLVRPRRETPGRCQFCSSKKNRKTSSSCHICHKSICVEHTMKTCYNCFPQNADSE